MTDTLEEMREALKPFARAAEPYSGNQDVFELQLPRGPFFTKDDQAPWFTVGDLRRARAALLKSSEPQGSGEDAARWPDGSCKCPRGATEDETVLDRNGVPRCPRCDYALGGDPMTDAERAEREAEESPTPLPEPQGSGWRDIAEAEAWTPALLYAPPEKLFIDPDGKPGEYRVAPPASFCWATHFIPLPSPPGSDEPQSPTPPTKESERDREHE